MKRKDYWDHWSKKYNWGRGMPLFSRWSLDHIFKNINLKNNPTIVDLGTGTGKLMIEIGKLNPKCEFIGVDISAGMLKRAKRNTKGLNVQLLENHLTKIDVEDETADYAISNASLHHVKNKEKLFSEVYRILKKKGKLVFSDSFDKPDKEFDKYKEEWKKKNLSLQRNLQKA